MDQLTNDRRLMVTVWRDVFSCSHVHNFADRLHNIPCGTTESWPGWLVTEIYMSGTGNWTRTRSPRVWQKVMAAYRRVYY